MRLVPGIYLLRQLPGRLRVPHPAEYHRWSLRVDPVKQRDLFAPYVKGSDTSEEAAESIKPSVSETEARVLAYIRGCGAFGVTDDQLEVAMGMRHQTASARRRGLVLKDLIYDAGERRKTRSGRKATVWRARNV